MRSILCILLFLLVVSGITSASPLVDKVQAKNIIIRTNRVIGHAQMSVKRGGIYSGDLSKSVIHERTAKKLYQEGNYQRAIHHARLARVLANQAIKSNKVKLPMDAVFTPAENQLFGEVPSDEELSKEAVQAQPY